MIFGIGTDLAEPARLAEKIEKGSGFKELVFSQNEIAYCEARKHKHEHYAARFAGKEAFLKALGSGWAAGTAFNEIEIVHNEAGAPSINFLGATAVTIDALHLGRIFISLSHVKKLATATVIIETK